MGPSLNNEKKKEEEGSEYTKSLFPLFNLDIENNRLQKQTDVSNNFQELKNSDAAQNILTHKVQEWMSRMFISFKICYGHIYQLLYISQGGLSSLVSF